MPIDRYIRSIFLPFVLAFIFADVVSVTPAFAANTTLSVSPQTGSYKAPFSVSLVIDGHGDSFNAAKANVELSDNLTIKDLVLGNCNFSFMVTPSVANPSFEGAILGGSSKKCTVYTLTLSPTTKGSSKVSLSKATVRRYGDAAEVLSSHQDGNYTITGISSSGKQEAQTHETPVPTTANGLYSVIIKVLSSDDKPVSEASVTLSTVGNKTTLKATTDKNGMVIFPNLEKGVYSVAVEQQKKQVAQTILNVRGPNHVLTLGINLKAQENNTLLKQKTLIKNPFSIVIILVVGVILGITIAVIIGIVSAVFPTWFKRRKKTEA